MLLPHPRGPLSAAVTAAIRRPDESLIKVPDLPEPDVALHDPDFQLTLWVLYELHYRSFDDAPDAAEWSPVLLAVRGALETIFDIALERECAGPVDLLAAVPAEDFPDQLFALTESFDSPPVAEHVQRRATLDQVRELLLLRSIYQLKEADPHSFTIPRLTGAAKAGLVELQYDEYGDGRADRVHQDLFATALRGAGLDPGYGAYVDVVPAETLAISTVMSRFCLHRGRRGAAMGHLAAFEATSSVPSRRYAAGIRRVGLGDNVAQYFDEHVEADAVHEQLAVRGICAAMIKDEPGLQRDIALGAVACLAVDDLSARPLLAAWQDDRHLVDPPAPPRSLTEFATSS
ncbi:iron-containing redox enzyme family protein [Microlunatus parietis]